MGESFDDLALKRSTRNRRTEVGASRTLKLSAGHEGKADAGMKVILEQQDLVLSKEEHKVYGGRVLEANSKKGYEKHYRGLRYFFSLIGDYSSLLILRVDAPAYPPAMSAKSVCAYLKFKTGSVGTPLYYDDSNKLPVTSVDGDHVLCQGQWKDPKNMVQFSAAVSAAHKAKDMDCVPYEESCAACILLYEQTKATTGCRHHGGRGRLQRFGNTRFSKDVINCMAFISKRKLVGYIPSPESMCNPLELINIRKYLLSTNDIHGWILWTMMLFHIRLFLRADEGIDFQCEQFLAPLTSVNAFGSVTMLAVRIKGKTDTDWVVLSIFRDETCPELCLVRAILAWLHLSKHNGSGYLFPHDSEPGHPYPTSKFQSRCREVCTKITGRQGPFATHWLRKTAWLLATWGGASDVDMMQASRHKSLDMAIRYKQDAQALLEIAKNQRYKRAVMILC
ncbi:hypothetical protein B5M09_013478 [Aphanomyces astaci]|uniref:Uncharacterized protein n=2 Tax=Aphanomyces astaci TaxID=112090 RepID=A0A425DFQ9_APHAT|nr:hypothetical protein B5M09_013478 [Aphanomyces astaci]